MREIKFRGKRLDNGEWLYGNLVELRNPFNPNDASACFIMPKEVNIAAPDSIAEQDVVDPDTVGQFTGLLDKNGKEIYEGDIISERLKGHRKYQDAYQVVFVDYQWCGKNGYGSCTSLSLFEEFHDIKVIGNIHDNPELLSNDEHDPGLQ